MPNDPEEKHRKCSAPCSRATKSVPSRATERESRRSIAAVVDLAALDEQICSFSDEIFKMTIPWSPS